jgi:hypothetical protein
MTNLYAYLPALLTFRPLLYGTLMWSVCIYAFLRGGREEKTAAIGAIVGAYLTFLTVGLLRIRYTQVELPLLLIDAGIFVLLLAIALRSKKFWPLWLTSFTGVELVSHLAPLMPKMLPETYYSAVALWGYPKLIVLAFGVANHGRRQAARAD